MGHARCSSHSIEQFLADIQGLLQDRTTQPRILNLQNAHIYNLTHDDPAFAALVNASRIVVADGMSIVWAARLFGVRMTERCNMTDSFHAFLADTRFPPSTALLIGGNEAQARIAADRINADSTHIKVTDTIDGFLTVEGIREALRARNEPDFVLIGMGSPKSEQVARIASERYPRAIVWHIGGGTVMFFAGSLVEAPVWMRRLGLQWLHRLLQEPSRMWRRYIIGNPLFVWRVVRAATRKTHE